MKKRVSFTAIVLILLVFSFVNANSQSLKKVRGQIEAMNAKMTEAMVNGDYNATLGMYTDDAYSLPSYSPMIKGIEAITASTEEMLNSPMKIKSFDVEIKDIMEGGDLFVEVGEYAMSMEMQGMPEPITDKGKYVTVWEKQKDGSLKIKVETWNSDVNPWE